MSKPTYRTAVLDVGANAPAFGSWGEGLDKRINNLVENGEKIVAARYSTSGGQEPFYWFLIEKDDGDRIGF